MLVPGRPVLRRYRADGALGSIQVHLPSGVLTRAAAQLGGPAVDPESLAASVSSGDPLVAGIIRGLATADEAGDLYAESAAAFLATHLLTHHRGRAAPRVPERESARVRTVIGLMHDRLAEPITLADLAGEVYLSVYHLVRVFKAATGETPHRFLTRLRIERARRLLRESTVPIAGIAPLCGFASPGALSTAFLRQTGVRPSAYRNS